MSVSKIQVIKAIKALKQFRESKTTDSSKKKKSTLTLTSNEDYIYVTASLYRIPKPLNTLPIPM